MKAKILSIIDPSTVKVIITTYKKHLRYGKYTTICKKFMVDSNGKNVQVGQEVDISSSKPISKRKKWIIK